MIFENEIIEAGYDYVEVRVNEFANKTDEEFKEFEESLKKSGTKLECFNCLFPGNIRITGPEVDYDISIMFDGENGFFALGEVISSEKCRDTGLGSAIKSVKLFDIEG